MRSFASASVILILSASLYAQSPATGFPPFGSFDSGGFDNVNLQNLNLQFAAPVVDSPSRGVSFRLAIVYNSFVWVRSGSNPLAWTPVSGFGWGNTSPIGTIQWKQVSFSCLGTTTRGYINYVYTDAAGTPHPFGVTNWIGGCNTASILTGYATDASGYFIDVTAPLSPIVRSPRGHKITSAGTLTDPNGNYITKTVVSSTETDWIDTLGRAALKVTSSTTTTSYSS